MTPSKTRTNSAFGLASILFAAVSLLTTFATLARADVALIVGNGDYSALRDIPAGTQVMNASDEIQARGFSVIGGTDTDSADILAVLEGFVDQSVSSDRVLVVLSGRFLNSATDSWLLPVDAEGTPQLARLPSEGLPLSTVLSVLSAHPGKALLVLGSDPETVEFSGPYLSWGIGDISIPQGVTVISGATAEIADFAEDILTLPAMEQTAIAARQQGLSVRGFAPPGFRFFGDVSDTPVPPPIAPTLSDSQAWDRARQADTLQSYRAYLAQHPQGRNVSAANKFIREIQTEPNRAARIAEQELALPASKRREIQRNLALLGYKPRGIDGIFGPGSRGAISAWQRTNFFDRTGYLTGQQIAQLRRQAKQEAIRLEAAAEKRRAELERADRSYWRATGAAGDEAGLRAYIKRYPDGQFAEIAKGRLKVINEKNRNAAAILDREAWDRARGVGTLAAYRNYLSKFPDGAFSKAAHTRIDAINTSDKSANRQAAAKKVEERMRLNGQTKRMVEAQLKSLGLKPGKVDGKFDKNTRGAIRRYQRARNLPVTGYLTQQVVVRLLTESILR